MKSLLDFLIENRVVTIDDAHYGNCVILAGGPASGKGTIQDLIMGDFKSFNVDDLKQIYIDEIKRGLKIDDKEYDFRDPNDTGTLHQHVRDLYWKDKERIRFFADKKNQELIPNIIFDQVCGKKDDIADAVYLAKRVGYKLHIVWVVSNIDTAVVQNLTRSRVVDTESVLKTGHEDAYNTMSAFFNNQITTGKTKRLYDKQEQEVINNTAHKVEKYKKKLEDWKLKCAEADAKGKKRPDKPKDYKYATYMEPITLDISAAQFEDGWIAFTPGRDRSLTEEFIGSPVIKILKTSDGTKWETSNKNMMDKKDASYQELQKRAKQGVPFCKETITNFFGNAMPLDKEKLKADKEKHLKKYNDEKKKREQILANGGKVNSKFKSEDELNWFKDFCELSGVDYENI